jgi:hypothetical protein
MSTFGVIKSSVLPNIYPIASYQDIRYFENRVERIGYHEEIFKTDKKFSAIGDAFFRERVIQVIAYNKYKLIFYVKENTNVELLKYSDVISVTLQDGTVHQALVIELNLEQLQPSGIRKVELIYADINSQNYNEYVQPVSNFCRSAEVYASLGSGAITLELWTQYSYSIDTEWLNVVTPFNTHYSYLVYTKLAGEVINTAPESLTDDQNGLKYASRLTSKRGRRYRFFVSEAQAAIIQKYISMLIAPYNGVTIHDTIKGDTVTNATTEMVIPEIKQVENAVDLWQIDIELYNENSVFNPYE